MPLQIEKLEAHTSLLLDAFISLKERYSMLDPMLFCKDVPDTYGCGIKAKGYQILRHSLFTSCVQDLSKICMDNDKRTPSINNLMSYLEDSNLQKELRQRFSQWCTPSAEEESNPEIIAAINRWGELRRKGSQDRFDSLYEEVTRLWKGLSESSTISAFLTLRNKNISHNEVK